MITQVCKLTSQMLIIVLSFGISLGTKTSHALSFNFLPEIGTPTEAIVALDRSGALWSSLVTDNVKLDIRFRFSSQEPSGAASTLLEFSYDQVRHALERDQTSASDFTAVNNLQSGPAMDFLGNLTSENPNGDGSEIPYLDNNGSTNNTRNRITASNAKALGLERDDALSVTAFQGGDETVDTVIILNPNGVGAFPWDFDRTDGITDGAIDFTGIVSHELGHVLGFASGVDILDRFPGQPLSAQAWVNTLDLFRFSDESFAQGASVFDWTASNTDKFFSIDGGFTRKASFSTGINFGDGFVPHHWNLDGTGIMDGVLTPFIGTEGMISNSDLEAIDVIGWDLLSITTIPEPSTFLLFGSGLIGLGAWHWKKRKTLMAQKRKRGHPLAKVK